MTDSKEWKHGRANWGTRGSFHSNKKHSSLRAAEKPELQISFHCHPSSFCKQKTMKQHWMLPELTSNLKSEESSTSFIYRNKKIKNRTLHLQMLQKFAPLVLFFWSFKDKKHIKWTTTHGTTITVSVQTSHTYKLRLGNHIVMQNIYQLVIPYTLWQDMLVQKAPLKAAKYPLQQSTPTGDLFNHISL